MSDEVKLVGGPADGKSGPRPTKSEMIGIPLDRNLNLLKAGPGEYYAIAIYGPTEDAGVFKFRGAQRQNPEDGFDVEFVDGPMQGTHSFKQAVQLTDATFQIALDADHKPLKKGVNVGAIAEYKRKDVDGIWKMALVQIVDAPKQTERFADVIGERILTEQLGMYTANQLVEELTQRQGFIGVVVMHPKELLGKWQLKAGSELVIAHNPQMSVENIKKLLRDALTALGD